MDIRFEGVDLGLAVAEELRRKGDNTLIIFLTSVPKYAPKGYAVRAFDYILKPVEPKAIFRVLDRVAEELADQHKYITVQGPYRRDVIFVRDIRMVESKARKRRLYLGSRCADTYDALEQLYQRLPRRQFAYANRSYVVNLRYVTGVKANQITVDSKHEISLGGRYKDRFISSFVDYAGGEHGDLWDSR